MTAAHAQLDELAEPLRGHVADYVERLQAVCGPELLAVTFYGPLWRPAPGEPAALANASVFRSVDLAMLARIAHDGHRFGRCGIAAPWALTPELIEDSRDTFPLELIEIAAQPTTVFGPDLFSNLAFDTAHVRLQCERELKVIEIHLQRGLLAAAGDERALARLGHHLGHTLLRVLRGLAWLRGERTPRSAYGQVMAAETATGRSLAGVRKLLDDSVGIGWEAFSQLHDDVQALRETADRL